MRLRHAHVERFKGVRSIEIDFMRDESILDRLLVLGDNGSGKTTLLQAITLVLGLATRRFHEITDFPWYGCIPERLGSLGPTSIELTVEFDEEEIRATHELFEACRQSLPPEGTSKWVVPGSSKIVTLRYLHGDVSAGSMARKVQFLGRYYLKRILPIRPELRPRFEQVGDVFWFDQYRNLGSTGDQEEACQGAWKVGVERLRSYLIGWWGVHKSDRPVLGKARDWITLLEERMSRVFPGFRIVGTEPMKGDQSGPNDFFVYVERKGVAVPYDISEMSSGEQAVFALAYDAVRFDIQNSLVLIDELELHLHPFEQQTLYSALPLLVPNSQFILTSHSRYLNDVVSDDRKVRLEGGRLCL